MSDLSLKEKLLTVFWTTLIGAAILAIALGLCGVLTHLLTRRIP